MMSARLALCQASRRGLNRGEFRRAELTSREPRRISLRRFRCAGPKSLSRAQHAPAPDRASGVVGRDTIVGRDPASVGPRPFTTGVNP